MTQTRPCALIVDDATTVRKYFREILEEAGFAVDEALNGIAALEMALMASRPYALMLVDVNMPQMDGYSLVRRLRAEPGLAETPVIMISTEREAEDADRGFEAGANLFLVKPVQPEALGDFARLVAGA